MLSGFDRISSSFWYELGFRLGRGGFDGSIGSLNMDDIVFYEDFGSKVSGAMPIFVVGRLRFMASCCPKCHQEPLRLIGVDAWANHADQDSS